MFDTYTKSILTIATLSLAVIAGTNVYSLTSQGTKVPQAVYASQVNRIIECENTLNDLLTAQAVIDEQLKNVPATIISNNETVPNRLHEQLSLENGSYKNKIKAQEQKCSALNSNA